MRAIDKRLRRLEGARGAGSQPKTPEENRQRIAVLLAKTTTAGPADILPEMTPKTLRRIADKVRANLLERQTK